MFRADAQPLVRLFAEQPARAATLPKQMRFMSLVDVRGKLEILWFTSSIFASGFSTRDSWTSVASAPARPHGPVGRAQQQRRKSVPPRVSRTAASQPGGGFHFWPRASGFWCSGFPARPGPAAGQDMSHCFSAEGGVSVSCPEQERQVQKLGGDGPGPGGWGGRHARITHATPSQAYLNPSASTASDRQAG